MSDVGADDADPNGPDLLTYDVRPMIEGARDATATTIVSLMTRSRRGMADKIVVMHDGNIEQMGTPLEFYASSPTCSAPPLLI